MEQHLERCRPPRRLLRFLIESSDRRQQESCLAPRRYLRFAGIFSLRRYPCVGWRSVIYPTSLAGSRALRSLRSKPRVARVLLLVVVLAQTTARHPACSSRLLPLSSSLQPSSHPISTWRSEMTSIRGVLIDLSGTLHVEDLVLPGCVAALAKLLARQDIGVRFVTNTTTKSRRELIQHLHSIGLGSIKADHVLTSGGIARSVLEQRSLRPLLLVDPSLEEEFDGLDRSNPNAVVVGLAPEHFHYDKLNEAFRVLLDGGSLIALHEARYFAGKDGLNIGPGAFVKALEFSAGVQATVIGKPAPAFYGQALQELNVTAAEAVMIGDDVRQDVHGAMTLGMSGALVQTGKYRRGDEGRIEPPPSYVATDFPDAVEWILQYNSSSE